MPEPVPPPPPSLPVTPQTGNSFRNLGILALIAAVLWSAVAAREGVYLALGCLVLAAASFAAWRLERRHMTFAAVLVTLSGLGACPYIGTRAPVPVSRLPVFRPFDGLMARGHSRQTRGRLGAIRSALSIYYGDMEGNYPESLEPLLKGGKYLREIPTTGIAFHHYDSNAVRLGTNPDDAGGWIYNNIPGDFNYATIYINCTHTDVDGRVWTTY